MRAGGWLCATLFGTALLAACGSGHGDADTPIRFSARTAPDTAGAEPATPAAQGLVMSEDACETDADCVPAGCCHAAACVGRANAPACGEALCTQDCRFGTLDCGGGCLCHEGRCAARLSEPPEALRPTDPAPADS